MDSNWTDVVELDCVEYVQGPGIGTAESNTDLVLISGRDAGGASMRVTVHLDDFERMVETVRTPWRLDHAEAEALAGRLILQQVAD